MAEDSESSKRLVGCVFDPHGKPKEELPQA